MNVKPKTSSSISVITLGCSKNTVDSEVLMGQIDANGLRLADDPSSADILIINTCGFIDAAKEESINTILDAVEQKRAGAAQRVYVAGCLSERYRDELRDQIPEVDRFFGVTDYRNIIEELGGIYRRELLGERHLSQPAHSSYLKISEGCDNPCSFCAIPLMRGGHISRPLQELVHEARFLAEAGAKELVLIGQDTTYYGLDRDGHRSLPTLLRVLSDVPGIEWIRLMYAYPSHFPFEILDVINERANVCAYLDMPIQHIADPVLKSMRRGITRRTTEEAISRIRQTVPGITLRTTLITGYPNEGDAEFEQLLSFVRDTEFDRLGVFTYSIEERTTAEILGDPIPSEVKEERRAAIMEVQADISARKNEQKVGSVQKVLFERFEGEFAVGRTEADAPEVDNEVLVPLSAFSGEPLLGNFYPVTILQASEFDLVGTISE
jgi:ribosomal protein S12 methylthiotransferase